MNNNASEHSGLGDKRASAKTKRDRRAAKGGGTIRHLESRGLWEARYTLGRDPGTGKQIQKSIYGKTQAEVRKKLAKIIAEIDSRTYCEPGRITLGAWADIWQRDYLTAVKQSTKDQYAYQIRVYIKPNIGAVKLNKLTGIAIQYFYNKCATTISAKSVHNLHGVLHKILDQAVKNGLLQANPSDFCVLPKYKRKAITPLSQADLTNFLRAIKGTVNEDMLFIDVFTGLRQGEILGLTWDCIDFDNGTITIYRQLRQSHTYGVKNKYDFSTLKNDKTRTISPAPIVMDKLRHIREQQDDFAAKSEGMYQNTNNLVFTNSLGRHLTSAAIYTNFKRVARRIGLPDARYHDLRHTFATLCLQNGDNIKTVSDALGHATVAFTLDIYGHVSDKMKKDSAKRMQNLIDIIASDDN